MLNASKQSGAKATASFNTRFQKSIWKLTFIYVTIVAAILFLSSSVIYSAFSTRLEHRFARFNAGPGMVIVTNQGSNDLRPNPDVLRHDLVLSLLTVDAFFLVCAGILSYWLALETLKPIKQTYERQQKFLGDASHELRTPLSILQTDLENELANPDLNTEFKEHASSNLEEVQRMTKLVGDLLTLSRLDEDAAEKHLKLVTLDLAKVIEEIVQRLSPLASQHSVSLHFAPKQSASIVSDEDLLTQALTNIIKNSIVYNRPEGQVAINLEPVNKEIVIKIADTGIGINSEDLNKIFDRFYRVDKSRSRKLGGSGLGLSIVRSSLDYLGGSVEIESSENQGTTVILHLPQKV